MESNADTDEDQDVPAGKRSGEDVRSSNFEPTEEELRIRRTTSIFAEQREVGTDNLKVSKHNRTQHHAPCPRSPSPSGSTPLTVPAHLPSAGREGITAPVLWAEYMFPEGLHGRARAAPKVGAPAPLTNALLCNSKAAVDALRKQRRYNKMKSGRGD